MPSIVSPSSFAQNQATVGHAYVFAAEQIRQEITEKLDVLADGLVMGVGDLMFSGSDTVRITRYGGIGYAEQMTAMTSETDLIVPTGFTIGYDSVSLGRYGLAKEQTYQDQVLGRAEAIGLDDLVAQVPNSFLATLRYLAVTAASTFSTTVGTAGLHWTYDDELEMVSSFHETEGFAEVARTQGGVVAVRQPEQLTDLRNSIRNEPGLQGDAALQQALLGLQTSTEGGAFPFLGIRNYSSHDVPTDSGDHVGGAYVPGAIAWVVASTMPITPENPTTTLWVPEFGIITERKSTGEVATARFATNGWFGVAKLNAALFPQFKLRSVNA